MRESWRTYICFVLAATIFILCQARSGGVPGNPADGISPDPRDRTYRDALRDETSGQGGMTLSGDYRLMVPALRSAASGEDPQSD